ncbi:MAG: GyrI-like domain-containing protein [Clostridium sp.]
MEKLDLKKEKSHLFKGKVGEIREVSCDVAYYITLEGKGNPNTTERYKSGVEALYKLAYNMKFYFKEKGLDFVVMPLSTLWWTDSGEKLVESNSSHWNWIMMIEIPNYITVDDINKFKEKLCNESELIKEISYNNYNEGSSLQVLYVGPYNEEGEIVDKLHDEIKKRGYKLNGKHHEIYLNDPRKVEPSKLKTIIRQPILKKDEELNFNEEVSNFFNKLGDTKTMVLSTSLENEVTSRNMSIISNKNKFYFQSDVKFMKSKQINGNKNVALCFDNIEVVGYVKNIKRISDGDMVDFKLKFSKYHKSSYEAYSNLIDNRVFEVEPKLIKLYCYEGKNVYLKYIDFVKEEAYKIYYLTY